MSANTAAEPGSSTLPMETTLPAIKKRDSIFTGVEMRWSDTPQPIKDRRYLLNLVERMRPYVERTSHPYNCSASQGSVRDCTCGLDALLEELKSE